MKNVKKYIYNTAFFVILIWITFRIIGEEQNVLDIFEIIRKYTDYRFILVGILMMFTYLILEGLNMYRTLKAMGEKTSLIKCIRYSYIGFFFSAITPAASGGQPMQIYYMKKDGIDIGHSTLSLLINLASFQIISLPIAIMSFIFLNQYMDNSIKVLFFIGVGLNTIALILLIIGIFSKKITKKILKFSLNILIKLRVKNIEKKKRELLISLDKYNGSAEFVKNNKNIIFKTLLTTFVQIILFYGITYLVYRGFGFNEHSFAKITFLQAIVFASVSGIPSPGSVGVSEGAFISIFNPIFLEYNINRAMIVTRGINFYLYVFVSFLVVIYSAFIVRKRNGDIEEK